MVVKDYAIVDIVLEICYYVFINLRKQNLRKQKNARKTNRFSPRANRPF